MAETKLWIMILNRLCHNLNFKTRINGAKFWSIRHNKLYLVVITLFYILSVINCTTKSASQDSVNKLISIDKEFSNLSLSSGMATAFITYAAEDVIKMNVNQHPVIGKQNLAIVLQSLNPEEFTLTWEPLKAEVDGNLGYTFGNYVLELNSDTTLYGNYVSIWRKQSDNTWKFVLDAGSPTPGPTNYSKEYY